MDPTAIPLPTILPDQTLAALPIHGQAVTQLGLQPAGIAIIAVLVLWVCLRLLVNARWR